MSNKSFIYRNLPAYRFIMNLLYMGKYKERFTPVTRHIGGLERGARVLELCFGDVLIADFCKKNGYRWKGIDINSDFVRVAHKMGYDAQESDVEQLDVFPECDMCIMMGSLYHFYPNTPGMLAKMIRASREVVISEPVSNLSSKSGVVGFLARRSANAGKGPKSFRYDKETFLTMIRENAEQLKYQLTAIHDHGKDIVVKLQKDERS